MALKDIGKKRENYMFITNKEKKRDSESIYHIRRQSGANGDCFRNDKQLAIAEISHLSMNVHFTSYVHTTNTTP